MTLDPRWTSARRVLCVRLDSMGDVLMTTPAIRAVKESLSGRDVTLLTSPSGAVVAPLVPYIDDAIVYEAPWLKATAAREHSGLDHDMIQLLRARRFDGAIVFTVFSQSALPSALLCFLADIPLRVAHARENPYQLLSSWIPDPEPVAGIRHEVERQLALVAHIGCAPSDLGLVLEVPSDARERADRVLDDVGIKATDEWIVLHPGATAPARRYPAEQFADAVIMLAKHRRLRVVVTGDASEAPLISHICARIGPIAVGVADRLDFAALSALIEAAPLLITNNTGPAHIAAAVGTPVVDLYALTNVQHTPWRVQSRVLSHDVPCKNCLKSVCPHGHNDCLRRVTPAAVADAALDLLRMSDERNASTISQPRAP